MALSIGTALLGAATIGGGLLSASAARSAAGTQAAASDRAAQLQFKQFKLTRADLAPWREAGTVALTELADLSGLPVEGRPTPGEGTREERKSDAFDRFFTSPGYSFRLDEGIRALDRSAAARGRLNSGAQGRELVRYGQGLASEEFTGYANRLSTLAGVGQTATATTGRFGANAATNAGRFISEAGEARASGFTGQANVISDTLTNLTSIYGLNQLGGLNQLSGGRVARWLNPDTGRYQYYN